MKIIGTVLRVLTVTAGIGVLAALLGCHEMKIETTVNADGSGTRHMELLVEAEEEEEPVLTLEDYRDLMGVTAERGWSHETTRRKSPNSDEMVKHHSFARTVYASDIDQQAEMSGDVLFKGTVTSPGFDGVFFANTIDVETGVNPRGRTITYRERFVWSGLMEALIDYRLEDYRAMLQQTYPQWKAEEINEWYAFFKGTFMAAVDDGIMDMGKGDRAARFGKSIERITAMATNQIRANDPDADDSFVIHITWSIFVEWDEIDKTAEEMDLLGVVLAVGLNLTVRIDIPGRIVETNADRQEVYADPLAGRQKLVWEIDPAAAMSRPIELYVKSEIPRPQTTIKP